jgi:NAD(P)-dependent dehydrogenase (short-subunit alcohol dehydrogenase family)
MRRRLWVICLNITLHANSDFFPSNAEDTAAAVRSSGGKAAIFQGDAAVEADVVAMFSGIERELGALDGVVINAGLVAPSMPLADMDAGRIRRVFEVNVIGAYLCARECARRLSRNRGGHGGSIVLVSSAAARRSSPFEYLDYSGSKAPLDNLTFGLAQEHAPQGVRVNAVRPGVIETEIHASGGQPGRAQRIGATTPLGRPGRPEEVAEAIVWLLSDSASYTTRAILDVAGGR